MCNGSQRLSITTTDSFSILTMEKRSKFDAEGWHYRGYLPHFEASSVPQFITFRLADSLPKSLFQKLRRQRDFGLLTQSEYGWLLDRYLDRSSGECPLSRNDVSELVRDSILYFAASRYELHSWVIMPNHVHLLVTLLKRESLSSVMHSLKSFTSHEANKLLNRTGRFWSKEYFDRYIRDSEHFLKTAKYIEMNPVKARLCDAPENWEFSSAYSRKK